MKSTLRHVLAALLCAGIVVAATAQEESILDVMTNVVTPVTNTIWGVENPTTDEEWQVYLEAADELIAAAESVRNGGAGPNDAEWAADPAWRPFADALLSAAKEVRQAAEAQDLDAFITAANDKMYPPCEECHLQFLPGMQ
jgi:hypothetical protein